MFPGRGRLLVPLYDFKCIECSKKKEYFLTMTEHAETPPTECEECKGKLIQIHDAGSPMRFVIPGEGAYYPNRIQ